MSRIILFSIVASAAMAMPGCDNRPSKVEQFKLDQRATETTHGPIELDSVQETSDGKLKYKTKDGSAWKVDVMPNADGTRHYGEPAKLDP